MSVKDTVARQYRRIVDDAAEHFGSQMFPKEGWLATMRKALQMSGPQLAKRAGVTKAAVYQAERKELVGEITIKQLEKYAAALGGRLVYGIVPDGGMTVEKGDQTDPVTIDDLIRMQAMHKAEKIVNTTHTHMALEQQALSEEVNREEIIRLAYRLQSDMPSDFWEKP